MILADMSDEMHRLSRLLDRGVAELRTQAGLLANAEHAYRRAKSVAWTKAPDGMLAAERGDWVASATADERRVRDLADGVRGAALEAVRSRRTQISALQSLLAAHKAEAEFDRTVPR